MQSPLAEKAVLEAQHYGKAILKFISANDCGLTGSHQAGFYLPAAAWQLYSPFPPKKGQLNKSAVRIVWQGGQHETQSVVTWYGRKTRDEYRLTCFGRSFPYLTDESVGDLLVLIPKDLENFLAFVIDLPDDIEDIQTALGLDVVGTWAVYDPAQAETGPSEEDCIDRQFRAFASSLSDFPLMAEFPIKTREALLACVRGFEKKRIDDKLLALMQTESRLFRLVERQLCAKQVNRLFKDIDDFVKTAATIMNRRRARPARSMESHVQYLLKDADVPFDALRMSDGEVSLLIPGRREYDNRRYPSDKLFVVGVRNTCKGRWWQITQDARRVSWKHIITIQEGISATQLAQIHKAKVSLVVPKKLHKRYPRVKGIDLLNLEMFINTVRKRIAS